MGGKIILNLAVSLDGYIADPEGGYDWIQPCGNSSLNTEAVWSHQRFLEQVSAVVMGRACYDAGMHEEYKNKQVYVVTTRQLEDRGNIHFVTGDTCRAVAALAHSGEGDVYLFGGGKTIDPLLKAGLIDEYVVGIIPIILGDGIPLFLPGTAAIPLRLTHHYVEDGVVILRYIPRDNTPDALP